MNATDRVAKPLRERQFGWLVKHFFGRFFDNELAISPQVEIRVTIIQILVLLILPGLVVSMFLFQKYGFYAHQPVWVRDLATLDDKWFFLSLSMILVGLITILEWDALFPDRKDYSILTPLPIETRTVFAAKLVALLLFLLLFTLAVNACPTVLFPLGVLAKRTTLPKAIWYVCSHAISILAGNAFVFFCLVSLQGLLLLILRERGFRVASRWIRFFLFFALVCALFSFTGIGSVDRLLKQGNPLVYKYPPMWFLGFYEVLLGGRDPARLRLAVIAAACLGACCLAFLSTYALNYSRHARKSLAQEAGSQPGFSAKLPMLSRIFNRVFLNSPNERANFNFVAKTMFRSHRHALYLGSFIGVGLALVVVGLIAVGYSDGPGIAKQLDTALLSIPLILSFFLLVGMRVIFSIPCELEANWIFRLGEGKDMKGSQAGARKVMVCLGIVPLFCLLAPFYLLLWNWRQVLLHLSFGLALSLILREALLFHFKKIPFACAYLPGKANLKLFWPAYVLAFTTYAYAPTTLESWMLREPVRFAAFFAVIFVFLAGLAANRARWSLKDRSIVFEEQPADALSLLDLRQ